MCKLTLRIILLALLFICFIFSISAFADSWQNERIRNRTGGTANDLEKWLQGDVLISQWLSTHFSSFSYLYNAPGNYTKLTWSNGTVPNGTWCGACVKTNQRRIRHKYLPRWSYAKSDSVAGPALSHEFFEYDPPSKGMVSLSVSNNAEDGGPMTIQIIQTTVVDDIIPMQKLVYDSLGSVNWERTWTNVALPLQGLFNCDMYNISAGKAVIYRAKVYLNSDPSNVVEYVGQFQAAESAIPTLTQWGLIILVALLVTSAVFIMLKKRKATMPV